MNKMNITFTVLFNLHWLYQRNLVIF